MNLHSVCIALKTCKYMQKKREGVLACESNEDEQVATNLSNDKVIVGSTVLLNKMCLLLLLLTLLENAKKRDSKQVLDSDCDREEPENKSCSRAGSRNKKNCGRRQHREELQR